VGSQLVSSLLMMTATADQNQKIIMLVLPFLFVGFVFRFPAGLIMYWITTNVWTIGQQQFLRRVIGRNAPEPPPLPSESGGGGAVAAPAATGGGGLFSRLAGAASGASAGNGSGNGAAPAKEESRVTKAPPPPPRQRKRKRSGRKR
jgi:YidC/Oxa1 family membrane protein insertase